MSVVTEHLEQRGSAFELLPHRQAYTSTDEARALGIDAGEVLKTLAVRTGPGYALVVIPASRRLDLHLVRETLGDHQARLASEQELARDFAGYQLGALPPLGALLGSQVFVDPEVLGHDLVVFAAGSQTESVRMGPGSCSPASRSGPCRWSSRRSGAATTRSVGDGRPSRIWQAAGTQRRNAFPTGDASPIPAVCSPRWPAARSRASRARVEVTSGPLAWS
jgi:Ala-tRNA(Pro) deacylase